MTTAPRLGTATAASSRRRKTVLAEARIVKHTKLLVRILSGRSDAAIRFADLRRLLLRLGFTERIRGSHHIFSRKGVEELINLQREGVRAKPYQVKQVREIILRYALDEEA